VTGAELVAEILFQRHGFGPWCDLGEIKRVWPRDAEGREVPTTAGEIYRRLMAERREEECRW